MSTEFRTKLRVKQWNYPAILKKLMEGQEVNKLQPAPFHVWRQQIPSRCSRCGLDWSKGPMGYACPEGSMCGVPRTAVPTVFIPQFSLASAVATPASKAEIWA